MSGKDRVVSFRLSEDDYQRIKAEADRVRLGVSEYVRRNAVPDGEHVCDANNADCAAHLYYSANPDANIWGAPRKIEPRLGRAVITFGPDDHEAIPYAADFYGVTVNEFFRQAAREKARGPLVRWVTEAS